MAGSPKWWAVTDWYIDPAQTYGGSDENDGLTSTTPIKSIAEWRRRIWGAAFGSAAAPTAPTIHVLSASSVQDDGLFYGFTCTLQTVFVKLLGTAQLIGTGTVTNYSAYSGNTRGSLTDSAIATSWTASGYVTTSTRSRFIRKVGSGARPMAPIIKDLGSKAVQLGITTSIDDTVLSFFPSQTETNFAVADAYEVVGYFGWPMVSCAPLASVGVQCLDISGIATSNFAGGITRLRLCGIIGTGSYVHQPSNGLNMYMCVFDIVQPAGANLSGPEWYIGNTAFVDTLLQTNFSGPDENTASQTLVFTNSKIHFYNGTRISAGLMRVYDCADPFFDIAYGSSVRLNQAVVGSNNSGAFVAVTAEGRLTGGSLITATTSDASPWHVSGVSYASIPQIDSTLGNAIYQ